MTSTSIRAAATAILGAVLGGGLACTAILSPRDDVDRCGSTDDCPPMPERRHRYECRFDPESDLDSVKVDKVCVPAWRPRSCAPPTRTDDTYWNYTELYDDRKRSIYYKPCSETPGAQGCRPGSDGCHEGLTPRSDGICDDGNPNTPPAFGYSADQFDSDKFWGHDVKDQFCRNFYCDDRFVCDTSDHQCVQCDPNKKIGEGGCGEIYSKGKPMCIYHRGPEIERECRGNESREGSFSWGDCTDEMPTDDDTGGDDPMDPTDPSDTGDTGDSGTTGGDESTGGTGATEDTGTTGGKSTSG